MRLFSCVFQYFAQTFCFLENLHFVSKAEPRHAVIRAKIASFLTYWLDVASVLLGIEITNKCLKMIITFIFGKIKYITKNKYLKFKTFLNVEHCLCINLKEF